MRNREDIKDEEFVELIGGNAIKINEEIFEILKLITTNTRNRVEGGQKFWYANMEIHDWGVWEIDKSKLLPFSSILTNDSKTLLNKILELVNLKYPKFMITCFEHNHMFIIQSIIKGNLFSEYYQLIQK